MNKLSRRFAIYLTAFASTFITACGGGGGNQVSGIDGSGAPVSTAPQTFASGTISGFGSVIVNGVHYASDKAKILVDDEQASENNLRAGYQVRITAHTNSDGSSTADLIEFHSNLIGPISAIDLSAQAFTILGQRVQVTSDTLFDANISPNYLEGLAIGNLVLVSGQLDQQNILTATRVELVSVANRQVLGVISALDETKTTFKLNDLTVNYSAASINNFDNNKPANGLIVSVKGSLDGEGVLQAKTLVHINTRIDSDVKDATLRGFITHFVSATDFEVAGTPCSTASQTLYKNGDATNLVAGAAVSIKGQVNTSGILVAQEIEFAKAITNEIAGEATNVSLINSGLISVGNFQINGTIIKTTIATTYEDNDDSHQKRFNFNDIVAGNFLKISGYNQDGEFIATKIEREKLEAENETTLKFDGLVLSTTEHSFVIFGRTVITNSDTEFKSDNGDNISEAQFYSVAEARRAKVEGVLKGGVFTATKVQLVRL